MQKMHKKDLFFAYETACVYGTLGSVVKSIIIDIFATF